MQILSQIYHGYFNGIKKMSAFATGSSTVNQVPHSIALSERYYLVVEEENVLGVVSRNRMD